MNSRAAVLCIIAAVYANAGHAKQSATEPMVLCSDAWQQSIDEAVVTGDGQGHGPDIGSDEWKSVVEFKLGIRDTPGIPGRDSDAWCGHIDQLVRSRGESVGKGGRIDASAHETGPSFSCDKVKAGGIEAMICADKDLSALDRKLAGVYAAASKVAVNEHPPVLKAEQRGWLKGRNECWKSDDERKCVGEEYERRIAELQARYRLVSHSGPFFYACDGNAANEVVATFFETDPATLIAERGDGVSLMFRQPSASGSKYQGRNEIFWEHQGEVLVTWGYRAPQMRCDQKAP